MAQASRILFLCVVQLCVGTELQSQVVAGDDFGTVTEDGEGVILVQDNDENFGAGSLTTTLVIPPGSGTATVLFQDSVRYTPAPDFNGVDTFRYRVCNEDEPLPACAEASVIITVSPANDPPFALPDTFLVYDNQLNLLDVQSNDGDIDGDALQTFVIFPPEHGEAMAPDFLEVEYQSDPGYLGVDSFRYQVCDEGSPTVCADTWVYLEVISGNLPPVAVNDTALTLSDLDIIIEVLANDQDPEGGSLSDPVLLSVPPAGEATVISGGRISYSPDQGFAGTDTFSYRVCDNGSPAGCASARVIVFVEELSVPDSFSPNADGIRDNLEVTGLQGFPDNELLVLDRRGAVVFRQEDYQNDWDGRHDATHQPLPEDVYLYQLRVAALGITRSGTITIRR